MTSLKIECEGGEIKLIDEATGQVRIVKGNTQITEALRKVSRWLYGGTF